MVHTAAAYAKQKNRRQIWACTSSIGPGALNMVTAAPTATVNRIPVPPPPGDNFACRQPDPVPQIETPSDYTVSAADAFAGEPVLGPDIPAGAVYRGRPPGDPCAY